MKLNKLDNYDMKILAILTIDCRTPDRQIGKKVGLSGVSVKSRITKMVRSGVIQNFTMKVEPASLGYGIIYLTVPSDDEVGIVKKLKLIGEPFFVVPCLGDIIACGIVVEKDVEQKTELVKNLISNARIVLTLDAKESEFRADLTKTDFKILDQLLKNPREKIDSISKSTMLSTKTVTRAIEKFEKNPAIQFTIIYDPRKLEKFVAFAVLAMVQSDVKKIKTEIEDAFGDYFWQVPFTAKELLVLFMYSDNIYNADVMRHKIKEIDGIIFTEVFFPKKITMPTNWISNSIKNAALSQKLHVPIKQINV
uniref:Transcriptional regulator AsnC family n=2 Tax=environmental samples TaxID=651140 RepID=A0A075HJ49_9ARCH|nr:transcriptional regulator AsnC family [uncultured marine thaumarchaeote KM3_196_E01]AIF13948.1 transcriptional regulator AsnC family [uncultured marine thaumarchaeote KM3_65_D04]